ncbi:RNase H domain-containing protein [Trichonephila clavipes]|nr:RNase H domain-containing protein [Trichonephila clavipes]
MEISGVAIYRVEIQPVSGSPFTSRQRHRNLIDVNCMDAKVDVSSMVLHFRWPESYIKNCLILRYIRLGESICHSLLDYYCATKYIPPDDVPKAVRESCCRGSRAKMVSNGNNKSPHRAASSVSGNEKKVASQAATSKTKSTKTRAVASKVLNDQKQSANQRPAHAKNA